MAKGRKRRSGVTATEETVAKRAKEPVESVGASLADEFVCPITTVLPVDPVTAEDGRIYERSAIEEHLRRGQNPLSPVTNEPIGPRLLPALQVRNMLENMVKDGVITGDKAARWKQRIEDERHVAETRRDAENGDADAMNGMGVLFEIGLRGVKKDSTKAYRWYKRAADAGHISGMASLGEMLINGEATEENVSEGMILLGRAGQGGSSYAAFVLGLYYFDGDHGLPKNDMQAKYWLERVVDEGEVNQDIMREKRDILAELDGRGTST